MSASTSDMSAGFESFDSLMFTMNWMSSAVPISDVSTSRMPTSPVDLKRSNQLFDATWCVSPSWATAIPANRATMTTADSTCRTLPRIIPPMLAIRSAFLESPSYGVHSQANDEQGSEDDDRAHLAQE